MKGEEALKEGIGRVVGGLETEERGSEEMGHKPRAPSLALASS